jgi:hypothetical protein
MRFPWRLMVWLGVGAAIVLGCRQLVNNPGPGPETGTQAPQIDGSDLAGHPMSLKDFHGKVVMLEFWKVG